MDFMSDDEFRKRVEAVQSAEELNALMMFKMEGPKDEVAPEEEELWNS